MKLLVLSTCNGFDTIDGKNILKPDGQHRALEQSLIKHGYDYEFFLYGFEFGSQYKVIKTFVDQYKGEATHILYTDAYDTIALAPLSEVISKFKDLNCKMLISAEKAYFPDNGESYLYLESATVWKYVNGGGCMFEIEFFKSITTPYPEPMMDPYWLRDIFLQYPNEVKLDYYCQIFQCLAHSNRDEWTTEDSRIKNIATQTYPIFFHGNGRTDMKWVINIATE
jgi:hypothetical protein